MNSLVACVCAGLMLLWSPPSATAQDGKAPRSTGVKAEAGVTAQGKGVALFDVDQDGDLDIIVAGRARNQLAKGVAVGDLDNDGWPDLFVARNVVVGRLYRNNGNGTFTEITQQTSLRESVIETIKIEGGKVEITGQSIKVEGGKVEIIRRKP